MRLLPCVFLIAVSEAGRPRPRDDLDDELPGPDTSKVDVYPKSFPEPVPFGHITLAGFGDPYSSAKQPLDPLELNMVKPRNFAEDMEMLKKGRRNIQFMKNTVPVHFASPRDKFLSEMDFTPKQTNKTSLKWFDLTETHTRDAIRPPTSQYIARRQDLKTKVHPMPRSRRYDPKAKHFGKHNFQLKQDQAAAEVNWTTCDEFGAGAIFAPAEIVKFEWTPFFIWSTAGYPFAIVHTFKYPAKRVVDDYRRKYKRLLSKTIDWSQPKLLMKGMTEMLLIAADKRGLFDAIPKHELTHSSGRLTTVPSLSLRLKIEDPYLVMMFCEDYFATVMAISGNEPTDYRDMKAEAASIKFVGVGRPVWRDKEGEREKIQIEQESKLREAAEEFIRVGESPPAREFDTIV